MTVKPMPYQAAKVEALRARMRLFEIKLTPTQSWEVLKTIGGDVGLAEDALLLRPRPKWLASLVGAIHEDVGDGRGTD